MAIEQARKAAEGELDEADKMTARYSDVFHLTNNEADGSLPFRLKEGYPRIVNGTDERFIRK